MRTDEPIGSAILYVESTVAPEAIKDFDDWCNTIHHFDTMRIEGFLSLRRFEIVESRTPPEVKQFKLLTLYQIADATAADFTTAAYTRHTETYVRPPDIVVGKIDFQRTIYERVEPSTRATQAIGEAMVSLRLPRGETNGDNLGLEIPSENALSTYRISDDQSSGIVINCERLSGARAIYEQLLESESGIADATIQLHRQVFPTKGVLLRDRKFSHDHGKGVAQAE